jgi:hypothetical protein
MKNQYLSYAREARIAACSDRKLVLFLLGAAFLAVLVWGYRWQFKLFLVLAVFFALSYIIELLAARRNKTNAA